jgi:hypothetical protein
MQFAIRGFSALYLAFHVFHSSPLGAQSAPPVEVGRRVRLTLARPGAPQESGRVALLNADSLVLVETPDRGRLAFRRAEIAAMDISVGERSHIRNGFAIGAVAGATIGGVAGYLSGKETCSGSTPVILCDAFAPSASTKAYWLGAGLGLVGGLVGVLAGVMGATDIWVPVTGQVTSIAPFVGNAGQLGLAIRF